MVDRVHRCIIFIRSLNLFIIDIDIDIAIDCLLLSGQTVVATSQIFILGIPAQLAATWFPPDQTSTATSIGVFGNQVRGMYRNEE